MYDSCYLLHALDVLLTIQPFVDHLLLNAKNNLAACCAPMTVINDYIYAQLYPKMPELLHVHVQDHQHEVDLMLLEHLLTQREVDE